VLGVLNWTVTWFKSEGPMSAEHIADQFSQLFLIGLLDRDSVIEAEQ
jgi:hypothetical protein